MPGQFWQHKNHFIVIRALQILKEQGVRVVVLATGAQSDPRNPGHFGRVREAIRAAGLQEQLILPGQVPYPLVSALMRACSALLNPSLFEGWSTTVEEARAFGVPMILSDLAVHREQAGPLAEYFGKDDAEALAKALERVVLLSPADRNKRLAAGMTEAERRSIKFVRDFIEAAHAAIEHPAASL
jgi:glycosyltransferase involved in cell wall biosynthesis